MSQASEFDTNPNVKFVKPRVAKRDNSLPYMPDPEIDDLATPERRGALGDDLFDEISPTEKNGVAAAYQSASKIPMAHGKAQLMPGQKIGARLNQRHKKSAIQFSGTRPMFSPSRTESKSTSQRDGPENKKK